jgi:3-methyl-2-oxobutanoate hydroxymethyltransferase
MDQTRTISLGEMVNHTRAVARGAKNCLVVADMPYVAYQKNPVKCLDSAKKFINAGADAVKVEWFLAKSGKGCEYVVNKLIKNKIPVMGHIGLTPQTAHLLGGYKIQGKDEQSAQNLKQQAKILENSGVFSLVLECVPANLAGNITGQIKVPTIGCGAGPKCDGQVLVLYDLLGLYKKKQPRFVRVYRDGAGETQDAVKRFIADIKSGNFPSCQESYK